MEFINYQPVHNDEKGNSVYADIINHCKNYRPYLEAGSKTTSAHEVTHGVNSEIRNANFHSYGLMLTDSKLFVKERLIRPLFYGDKPTAQINAFYLRQNRAIILNEPAMRKSDIIEFIPTELRDTRYNLYVAGQREWDGQPLYIFDEWVAYTANAVCAVDEAKNYNNKSNSDEVYGVLEFVAYGVAVLMAADKRGLLEAKLADFTKWQLREAFNAYFDGRELFAFPGQEKILGRLQSGPEWSSQRDFLKNKLGFTIPNKIIPHDEVELKEADFKVIGL